MNNISEKRVNPSPQLVFRRHRRIRHLRITRGNKICWWNRPYRSYSSLSWSRRGLNTFFTHSEECSLLTLWSHSNKVSIFLITKRKKDMGSSFKGRNHFSRSYATTPLLLWYTFPKAWYDYLKTSHKWCALWCRMWSGSSNNWGPVHILTTESWFREEKGNGIDTLIIKVRIGLSTEAHTGRNQDCKGGTEVPGIQIWHEKMEHSVW